MPRTLQISGAYPADWQEISDRVCVEAGHRCIRCGHPFEKGKHGKGQWTPCDDRCTHKGPLAFDQNGEMVPIELLPDEEACDVGREAFPVCAEWRILTTHHLNGDKSDCFWGNLAALCQRCHLIIQGRVNPATPYFLEHSDWFKPYAAAHYARKYLGETLTREQVMARLDELLALERLA